MNGQQKTRVNLKFVATMYALKSKNQGSVVVILHLDMEKHICKASGTILAYDYAVNKDRKTIII